MQPVTSVLAIDDEPFNLMAISTFLEDEGYEVITATDGAMALQQLVSSSIRCEVILLDWMMPGMDGIEVLSRLKANPNLAHIPVIMQTGRGAHEDLVAGMNAGAFYYLTKPYEQENLRSILASAIADSQRYAQLRKEIQQREQVMHMLTHAQFKFRTLHEARNIAHLIVRTTNVPTKVLYGLSELMINAIEHGNLGITYEEKTRLNIDGTWHEEVARRLAMPEYQQKHATLNFASFDDRFIFTVTDQGNGFCVDTYWEFDTQRLYHTHGRGIYLARTMSFDRLDYQDNGRTVIATVYTKPGIATTNLACDG